MKKLIALCLILLSYSNVMASDLVPLDSIGIEKVGDQTFIIHQVGQGETLFAISRRYQTAINDILQNNEQLKDGLKMGQKVRIPYISKSEIPEGAKLHRVSPGETLFSISKQYDIKVDEIMAWNELKGNDLSVGQALVIKGVVEKQPEPKVEPTPAPPVTTPPATPTSAKEEVAATGKASSETKEMVEAKAKEEVKVNVPTAPVSSPSATATKALPGEWINHTVGQGETLFSIAKAYDAKIDDLITWNSLSSNNLSIGQQLKVGREPSSDVPVVTSSVPIVVNNQRSEGELAVSRPESTTVNRGSTAYKNVKETGLAEVIEGTGNHKKYLVLHRSAPVGTIMRVRNEENDIMIFARVVGKLPETGDNSKLVIKLSKAAYDQLRAVNTRFPVEISY
jgi:LysM repeat protein